MIPEAVLVLLLIVVFIADFATSKQEERRWFNPFVGVLMLAAFVVSAVPWEPQSLFGGMYVTTAATNVMKAILTGATLIVIIMSRQWLYNTETKVREGEFYLLTISTLLGMYTMMSAGHFLMFFLGLEMASIPMACLVALDKWRNDSAEGAAKYILTATFSSGVMLMGLSLLYGACGTLYFTGVAAAIKPSLLTIVGVVFFLSGLGFKISLVPFHFWTADTYQGAPTVVTGYLSVVSKGAAAFTLMVILLKVFASMAFFSQYFLYVVIVLSITVANLFAIRQSELKRFMAFSSISQAGYIMLALVGNDATSPTALMYYILVYVVANLSVFSIISVVEQNNGGRTDIDAYNGFYKTNPKLSFLMTLALFSLAGIPPFAGMFSKFFVFMAAGKMMDTTSYIVLFIALVNTVVSLYYYLLIVKAMYIKDAENPLPTFKSDCGTRLALAICTAGVFLFGIVSCLYDYLYRTAEMSF